MMGRMIFDWIMLEESISMVQKNNADNCAVQGNQYWKMHLLTRADAWHSSTCDNAGFLIYASTLHNIGWIPEDTDLYGQAMAQRVQRSNRLSCCYPESLLKGDKLAIRSDARRLNASGSSIFSWHCHGVCLA
jgi:hypothetical protein